MEIQKLLKVIIKKTVVILLKWLVNIKWLLIKQN